MTKKCRKGLYGIATLLLCVSVALGVFVFALADSVSAETKEENSVGTPAFTYVIGDDSVTNDDGFTYNEATKTYVYRDHSDGFKAATSKSVELYDEENEDANLVGVKLASTWNVTSASNATAAIVISNVKCNVSIDLNGNNIDRGLEEPVTGGRVINVTAGILEITDTSESGNGKITGGYLPSGHNGAGLFIQNNTSKVIFSGGSIEGNVSSRGGGVSLNGGTFIMNGGFIKGNRVTSQGNGVHVGGGNFIMNGGSVCDNNETAVPGGGIVVTGGKLTINGGTVKNNFGTTGGAINIQGGSAEINGGEISYNTAKGNSADNSNGGAVYVGNGGSFYVNGGEIYRNYSGGAGGGIWGYNITVAGGKISENYATGNGGGLHVRSNALKLANCEISGNNGNGGGGAYYCYSRDAEVTLEGAVILKDNTTGATHNDDGTLTGGTVSNTTIRQEQKLIVGKMSDDEGNKAEFHFDCALNNAITEGYEQNNIDEYGVPVAPSEYFVSDNAAQHVVMNSDGEICMSKSVFVWDATCKEQKVNNKSAYGVNITYSVNEINAVTLTQDGTAVTDLKYTDANGDEISTPLVNAGTYYVIAENVNGLGNNKVNTKYVIVIAPYDISDGEGGAAVGVAFTDTVPSDWTKESDTKYTAPYSGSAKAIPSATVTVNSTALIAEKDFEVVGVISGAKISVLNNVGEYSVEIRGKGNYSGAIALSYTFAITPDNSKNYTTSWQYYDGENWIDLADAELTYSTSSYDENVRIKLVQEETGEIRYVYALGTQDYKLAEAENAADVSLAMNIEIAKGDETALVNAGTYNLTIEGTPNYNVPDADASHSLEIAPYSLEGKGEEIVNSFNLLPTSTVYDGNEKEIKKFTASVQLDSVVTFGSEGAEYNLVIKYVGEDGEKVVDKIILGGDYNLYIEATGNNFTGVSDAIAKITVTKATNRLGWDKIGNWMYGSFDKRVHNSNAHATYLHDGTLAPAQYIMYSILDAEGEPINATLTEFTEYTDEVAAELNALNVGDYTVYAQLAETESYTGASSSYKFNVAKAFNGWTQNPDVVRWIEGKFNADENVFLSAPAFGEANYVITDVDGNVLYDSAQGIDKRAEMKAGNYILTATVEGTDNYDGLTGSFSIRVLEKVGLPWWVTLVIVVGSLLVVAVIILILWKKGVFRILTGKLVLAIRTKATVDATIASVRAAKMMEEGKKSVAEAKRRERIEQLRKRAEENRALSPEERAARLEEKAQANAEKAEKIRVRSEKMQKRAARLRGNTIEEQQLTDAEPESEVTEATENPTEE